MSLSKKTVGALGEKLAGQYLQKQGYRIIETNFKCRFGEMDIIAAHKDTLCFVEVKTRSSDEFGLPEESVTAAKQKRQTRIARYYLYKKKLPSETPGRFDVVAIRLTDNKPVIDLIAGAFPFTV